MTAKVIVLLACIFTGIISCVHPGSNGSGSVDNTHRPALTASQIIDKMEHAYKLGQPDSLRQIFTGWNSTVKPNTRDFIEQDETIKAVFDVYREFYKPRDLLKLGEWEWGNELNAKSKYVIVQSKILFSIDDNFEDFNRQKAKQDSIINFRPPIDLTENEVLYLTREYSESLTEFLGTESSEVGEGNIMNPSKPEGESEKRYEMIREFIPVLQGHWGRYWHLETHPVISIMVLNKSLTKSKIFFRVGYQGGETLLEKKKTGWSITDSRATWIE